MAGNEGSANKGLPIVFIFVVGLIFAGCYAVLCILPGMFGGHVDKFSPPLPGSYIDEKNIITIQEKWRRYDGDCVNSSIPFSMSQMKCGYSYYAMMTNGNTVKVNSEIYPSLPLNQTGIGRGQTWGSIPLTIEEFYPVNVSHFSDVRGVFLVIP